MKRTALIFTCLSLALAGMYYNQDDKDPEDIIRKMDEKFRGETSNAALTMTIVRPKWDRTITIKSWSKGDKLSLILITGPERDKGTAFLKKDKEVWNWQPTIERIIKLPPSMMTQSWMGSDFTNDDLVRESSIVKDYDHKLLKDSTILERPCYKIELTPKQDAAVVWGKIYIWADKKDYMQLRAEFYDEDDILVNVMQGSKIKSMGGKLLPSRMEMIPMEEDGHKTVIEYQSLVFDKDISDDFFSVQNMKKVR